MDRHRSALQFKCMVQRYWHYESVEGIRFSEKSFMLHLNLIRCLSSDIILVSSLHVCPNHLSLAFLHLSVMPSSFSLFLMPIYTSSSLFQFLHMQTSHLHCLHPIQHSDNIDLDFQVFVKCHGQDGVVYIYYIKNLMKQWLTDR